MTEFSFLGELTLQYFYSLFLFTIFYKSLNSPINVLIIRNVSRAANKCVRMISERSRDIKDWSYGC